MNQSIFTTIYGDRIWVSPVSQDGAGFYANTRLEDGWWVQHWGETEHVARDNLIEYIQSGQYLRDREPQQNSARAEN